MTGSPPNSALRPPARTGFTLVELVIVVAIISLLAITLTPAVAAVMAAGRSATCQNNLHVWGVAMMSYATQSGGHIPRRGQGIQPTFVIDRDDDWFNCLPPGVNDVPYKQRVARDMRPHPRDGSIFVCPEANDDTGQYFFSYAMNMYLSPWIRPEQHRYFELESPESTVFLADAPGPYSSTVPSKNSYSVAPRHRGRANLVFITGQVECRDGAELGCGVGNPHLPDVRWETGSSGVNQASVP